MKGKARRGMKRMRYAPAERSDEEKVCRTQKKNSQRQERVVEIETRAQQLLRWATVWPQ